MTCATIIMRFETANKVCSRCIIWQCFIPVGVHSIRPYDRTEERMFGVRWLIEQQISCMHKQILSESNLRASGVNMAQYARSAWQTKAETPETQTLCLNLFTCFSGVVSDWRCLKYSFLVSGAVRTFNDIRTFRRYNAGCPTGGPKNTQPEGN